MMTALTTYPPKSQKSKRCKEINLVGLKTHSIKVACFENYGGVPTGRDPNVVPLLAFFKSNASVSGARTKHIFL